MVLSSRCYLGNLMMSQQPIFHSRFMNLPKRKHPNLVSKNCAKTIHHLVRRKRNNVCGHYTAAKFNLKRIHHLITSIIIHHVIILVHAIWIVHAYKRKTFAKSFVTVAAIVRIDFRVVVARLNVIPNNVLAIWLYVNVILIFVKLVERINLNWRKSRAKMFVYREDYVSIFRQFTYVYVWGIIPVFPP